MYRIKYQVVTSYTNYTNDFLNVLVGINVSAVRIKNNKNCYKNKIKKHVIKLIYQVSVIGLKFKLIKCVDFKLYVINI